MRFRKIKVAPPKKKRVHFSFHTCYTSRMQERREKEADLAFDISMALRGAPLRKDADACVFAKMIVEHLRLCRWTWRRREPDVSHGSF